MKRLVYSPKAYVYIQTDEGMYNISDLVVSGSVSRKVNQVSTAEVTFQNPDFTFTQPGTPTFRPMDKITIFLQRLPGFPVQSFTGYLDETPYFQMYPGTVTLRASCTLKKLQYTYFDPGLPFMIAFMARYGWFVDPNTGAVQNPATPTGSQTKDMVTSASMTDLMYACLKHIGGIDPGQILIEDLPDGLIARVSTLYQSLHIANSHSEDLFNQWLSDFVGGQQGTGGTAANESAGSDASGVPYAALITKWARTYKFDPALIAAIIERESNFQVAAVGHDPGGTIGQGLMQLTSPGYKVWISSYIAAGESPISANIHAGCRALREKVDATGSLWAGVRAYNGSGPAAEEYMNDVKNNRYPKFQQKFKKSTVAPQTPADGTDTSVRPQTGTSVDGTQTTKDASGSGTTRFDAVVARANKMNELVVKNGLHYDNRRPPSDTQGYDCSTSIASLIHAAGWPVDTNANTGSIRASTKGNMVPGKDPSGRFTIWNNDDGGAGGLSGQHIFAEIKGRWFTTAADRSGHWVDNYHGAPFPGYRPFHMNGLDEPASIPAGADTSTGAAGSGGSDGGTGFNDALAAARAGSVLTTLNFPQAIDAAESILLTGSDARGKALMNDQPLLPFIEQLANGSLRNFMSLPNGDFYAFHPDYFGAMGTSPYWEIDDIEVLEGGIQLSDDALSTHVFVVGATLPDQQFDIIQKLNTHGVVNILNAGTVDFLNVDPAGAAAENKQAKLDATDKKKGKTKEEELRPFLGSEDAALSFLQRYGARPMVEEAPFIRSHIFETFYAYQKFMLGWARQFQTTFSFTFMPEIYPGGIVSFKGHGIQMYVDEVHHSWDYQNGFTTQANLTAPSGTDDEHKGISRGMVRSFINRKDG